MMLDQDMDMKNMVDVMKATGDLYVNVIENIQCVMNSNVILLLASLSIVSSSE